MKLRYSRHFLGNSLAQRSLAGAPVCEFLACMEGRRALCQLLKQYAATPTRVRRAFDKQSRFLLQKLQHPSLRAKKYDEALDLWQARVTRDWRFYFTIEGDEYHLHELKGHPK